MKPQTPFDINEARYLFFARLFKRIEARLGLKIRVDYDDERFKLGQIFLFNHFARFETVIPPYVIHNATGAYCRTIAANELFDLNDGFTRLLYDVGAVPTSMPGLLPYLAAEILRGRKIVVFPEGRMVKDRRVVDQQGALGVYSARMNRWRRHHRGAAVLALTLDIFKERVRELFRRGDEARIERWVRALGLEDAEVLRSNVAEATIIVPANITFFPVRGDDNIASRIASRFARHTSLLMMEELVVESNLILNDTDMDIRLGDVVVPKDNWRWWERLLLERYFRDVDSLDELFGLRHETADNWWAKLLARCLDAESTRIRDRCMAGMYAAVSVNINHVAAVVIMTLASRERTFVKRSEFRLMVYCAIKRLQKLGGINLHDTLSDPDRYKSMLRGESADLDGFMEQCLHAKLISFDGEEMHLRNELHRELAPADVRLRNPVRLYVNEIAALKHAVATIESSADRWWAPDSREFATARFDDELLAHESNARRFAASQYQGTTAAENASAHSRPFLLQAESRTGVLLVHDFLASPAELAEYGRDLHRAGYCVLGVRLAGHGTSAWDLKRCTWQDWLASVKDGFETLGAFVDHVVAVGVSAGGTLVLLMAAGAPGKLAGVAVVCPAISYRSGNLSLVPLVHSLNSVTAVIPALGDLMPFRANDTGHPHIDYSHVPISGLYQMRAMSRELLGCAAKVRVPVQLVQATEDPVVDPAGAQRLLDLLTVQDKTIHWIDSNRHGLLHDDVEGARAAVTAFVRRVGTCTNLERTGT